MEEKIEKLLNDLKEIRNELGVENDNSAIVKCAAFQNIETTLNILNRMSNSKTVEDALNDEVRTYEDALAKCLEVGAVADSDFVRAFTSQYLCNILGILSNLCVVEDFTKNKDNVDFLKSKIKECLKHIDRL